MKIEIKNGELDDVGFILDFGDLSVVKDYIDEQLDHRHLNDVLGFNSTAENMARHLHGVAQETLALPEGSQVTISVSETPKTWAHFTGGTR